MYHAEFVFDIVVKYIWMKNIFVDFFFYLHLVVTLGNREDVLCAFSTSQANLAELNKRKNDNDGNKLILKKNLIDIQVSL